MKETEKKPTRSARRYVLALPVQLARGSGLTRDVSAGGVYFLTDQAYPLDSQVDLTLVLGATLPGHRFRCNATRVWSGSSRVATVSGSPPPSRLSASRSSSSQLHSTKR